MDRGQYRLERSGVRRRVPSRPRRLELERLEERTLLATVTPISIARPVGGASVTANAASSVASISGDGRYTVFLSEATDLVDGQVDFNAANDVFLLDRKGGSTKLLSGSNGSATTTGNGVSVAAVISADGNYVAFTSFASDLVPGQSEGSENSGLLDLFLYDVRAGTTTLVSRAFDSPVTPANGEVSIDPPAISADGRRIAFSSTATNLIQGVDDFSGADVFLFDRGTDAGSASITLVNRSVLLPNTTSSLGAFGPSISADGRYVVYSSYSDDLVVGQDDGGTFDVDLFLFDASSATTVLVTGSGGSATVTGNGESFQGAPIAISAHGRYVAFRSFATDLVSGQIDGNNNSDVFVFDRDAATGAERLRLVSRAHDSAVTAASGGSAASDRPVINVDLANDESSDFDLYVAYQSTATNLVAGSTDSNGRSDVFLYSLGTFDNILVSHVPGSELATSNLSASNPSISGDGRFVAYSSTSFLPFLVAGVVDSNLNLEDVLLYDRDSDTNELVSSRVDVPDRTANSVSRAIQISGDGSTILFRSFASNLIANDANGVEDLFLGTNETLAAERIDLSVTLVDSQDPAIRDQQFSFTATVQNAGPAHATGVVLEIRLLAGMSVAPNTLPAACSVAQMGTEIVVSCDLGGIAPGVDNARILVLEVRSEIAAPFETTATVTANEPDANESNNSAVETTRVNPPPPGNDHFASPTPLTTADGTEFATNRWATRQPSIRGNPEPKHAGRDGNHSVWFRWVPDYNATVRFDTFGSNFDTLLGVYVLEQEGTNNAHLREVASSDDVDGGDGAGRVFFDTQAGRNYYIAVDGYVNASGDIQLNWMRQPLRPVNDQFANAQFLTSLDGSEVGTNVDATVDAEIKGDPEPPHVQYPARKSVWYRWTPNYTDQVTFNTAGSTFDTRLAVYQVGGQGSGDEFLHAYAANDDFGGGMTSQESFRAIAGQTYFIAVDGYSGASGTFHINWARAAEPRPAPARIHSIDPPTALRGRGDLPLSIHGSGFQSDDVFTVRVNGRAAAGDRFVQTQRVSDSLLLATVPDAFFDGGNSVLNITVQHNGVDIGAMLPLHVTSELPLPPGSCLSLGQIELCGDTILQTAGGSRFARAARSGVDTYELTGNVAVNRFLAVDGSKIEVVRDLENAYFSFKITSGAVRLTDLPGIGSVTLLRGPQLQLQLDGNGQLTSLAQFAVETPLRAAGLEITIDRVQMLLGSQNDNRGNPILGVRASGNLKIPPIGSFFGLTGEFTNLEITQNYGVRFTGAVGLPDFNLGGFGLNGVRLNFTANDNPLLDELSGIGSLVAPAFTVDGYLRLVGGRLDSIGAHLGRSGRSSFPIDVSCGIIPSTNVPTGPAPPPGFSLPLPPFFRITGGGLSVGGLETGPFSLGVSADLTIVDPALAALISLNRVGVKYTAPGSLCGGGNLRVLKFDLGALGLDLDVFNKTFGFDLDYALPRDNPVFSGQAHVRASLQSGRFSINGSGSAAIQIPTGNGLIFDSLRAVLGRLPFTVASASVSYINGVFQSSVEVPVLGRVSLLLSNVAGAVQAAIGTNFGTLTVGGRSARSFARSSPTPRQVPVPENSPAVVFGVSSATAAPRFTLIRPDGSRLTPELAAGAGAVFAQDPTTNRSVFIVPNPAAGIWQIEPEDDALEPYTFEAIGANAPPVLGDLQVAPSADGFHLNAAAADPDDDAVVSLYFDTDADGFDGRLIAENLTESEASNVSWVTNDGSVPSGEYYVYAIADDGRNFPARRYASTKVSVIDPLAPAQPLGVSVVPGGENSLVVSWTANTEADLGGYQVRYAVDQGPDTVLAQRADAGRETSLHLPALGGNTTYRVAVVAFDRTEAPDPENPGQTRIESRASLPSVTQTATTATAVPPVVEVTAPNGAEKLTSNLPLDITWQVDQADDLLVQQLEISTDGGDTFMPVAMSLPPDARSFAWQVPAVTTGASLRMRVTAIDRAGNRGSGMSDADFSIESAGSFEFSAAEYVAAESDGIATITVRRTGGVRGIASVRFATSDGSATAGSDYAATRGLLTFLDGETSQSFRIAVMPGGLASGSETVHVQLSGATGGARVSGTGTAILSITDTSAPTIRTVELVSDARGIQRIVLTASEPLAATAASSVGNYSIKLPGKDRRFNSPAVRPDDVAVALRSATYDPATRRITLTPTKAIKLGQFLQVTANSGAAGLTDLALNQLDGNSDGVAGDHFASILARGTKLSYVDSTLDSVSLTLTGGGIMQLTLSPGGDGQTLSLQDTIADRSILTGSVKKPKTGGDNRTTINLITGMTGVRNSLPINPPLATTGRFVIGSVAAAVVDSLLEADELFGR